MMTATHDWNEAAAEVAEVAELVGKLAPNESEPAAALALKALSRRRLPEAAEQASRVLGDRRFPTSVRSVAAVELGKSAGADREATLLKAIGQAEPEVQRHILNSLGRIGGEAALDRLASLDLAEQSLAGQALAPALTLIAYRVGSDRFLRLPPPPSELRPPSPEGAMRIAFRSLTPDRIAADMPLFQRELPATPLSRRNALAFACGNSDYRVVVTAEFDSDEPFAPFARPSILGAILKYWPCPGNFSVDAYLLSSPRSEGYAELVAIRPSGVMVLAGGAELAGPNPSFELVATRSLHYRKMRLRGDFARTGRLRIDESEVGREIADDRPRRRPLPRSPDKRTTELA